MTVTVDDPWPQKQTEDDGSNDVPKRSGFAEFPPGNTEGITPDSLGQGRHKNGAAFPEFSGDFPNFSPGNGVGKRRNAYAKTDPNM